MSDGGRTSPPQADSSPRGAFAPRVAARMSRFEAEGFERILAGVQRRRAAGLEVLPLHAGEPDFDTPRVVVDAAIEALRRGETRYTPAAGIPRLRESVAVAFSRTRGVEVGAEHVVVAPGAKPLIYFGLLAACEAGDEVVCLSPAYPIYRSLIRFVGGVPRSVAADVSSDGALDVDAVARAITPRTRALILNSPNNPTGRMLAPAALQALARLAEEHDLLVISDEIYSRITYERAFASIASLPGMLERTLVIDGFSKTYAMTGWRLGYGVMHPELARRFATLMLNTLSCNVAFTQSAAVAALESDPALVEAMVASLRRRRDMLVAALNQLPGVRCELPDGAFYTFPDVRALGLPSGELADLLLERHGVAVYPGSAFGAEGEGHLRLTFACSSEQLSAAVERLGALATELA